MTVLALLSFIRALFLEETFVHGTYLPTVAVFLLLYCVGLFFIYIMIFLKDIREIYKAIDEEYSDFNETINSIEIMEWFRWYSKLSKLLSIHILPLFRLYFHILNFKHSKFCIISSISSFLLPHFQTVILFFLCYFTILRHIRFNSTYIDNKHWTILFISSLIIFELSSLKSNLETGLL